MTVIDTYLLFSCWMALLILDTLPCLRAIPCQDLRDAKSFVVAVIACMCQALSYDGSEVGTANARSSSVHGTAIVDLGNVGLLFTFSVDVTPVY